MISNPAILTFYWRRSGTAHDSPVFQVFGGNSASGPWTQIGTRITSFTTTYQTFTFDLTGQSNIYIRVLHTRTSGANQVYIDDFSVTASAAPVTPTKLAITIISPSSPTAGSGFNVTVAAQDALNVNVTNNTGFTLSSNGNAVTIGGTTTGFINAGNSCVTVNGVILPSVGTGVTLTATRTSGDILSAGTSSTFSVIDPNAVQWTDGDDLTAWFTNTNWTPNTLSGAWTTSSIAQFNSTGTETRSGINQNTVSNLSIGAVEVTNFRNRTLDIGNSSGAVR